MMKIADGKKGDTNNRQIPAPGLPGEPRTFCPGAVGYEIRVKDHLETYWFEWFEGWSVTNLENGEVMLKSDQVDQSKLHGTLNKIRDLNLTLLSVTCVQADDQTSHPSAGKA
jgi:hypothetical protein